VSRATEHFCRWCGAYLGTFVFNWARHQNCCQSEACKKRQWQEDEFEASCKRGASRSSGGHGGDEI